MRFDELQLPLPFPYAPLYDARDFIPASSNEAARAWLGRMPDWPDRRLALWGQSGAGKSHLLHVWAEQMGAKRLSGPLLRGIDDVPESGAVALDDADGARSDAILLHVLNTARERGLFLLMAARTAPARWPVHLPDLSSRLRAVAAVALELPDDTLMRMLLVRLIADRQLVIAQPVQDWLLVHLPRSPDALRDAVSRLDKASLMRGKAITRSLATRLLVEDDEVSITDCISSSGPARLL